MGLDGAAHSLIRKSILIGVLFASIGLSLLLGELLTRLIVEPGDFLIPTVLDDPVLGNRIKPYTGDHDALGFRNAAVPERATIVAIGDSQTYGLSAPRDGSWPYQLSELLHKPVYNMALGGYGPLQYLHLAEHEALKLKPRQLIVGFYLGNDLGDAYRNAFQMPYWKNWREADSLKSDESGIFLKSDDLGKQQIENAEQGTHYSGLREWLAKHSVLYSILKNVLISRLSSWKRTSNEKHEPDDKHFPWVDPASDAVSTVFTPQWRFDVLDIRHSTAQKGMRITKRAFTALKKVAEENDIRLLIVLIPTKERVYCSYVKESTARIPKTYINLCEVEEQVNKEMAQFFIKSGIAYVDAAPAMEKQTFQHAMIYPKVSDGHPLAAGYGVIAQTVYDTLVQDFK